MRKKCRLCRWKACVDAGMSLNKVRAGRIPDSMKKVQPKVFREDQTDKSQSVSLKFLIKYKNLNPFNLKHIQSSMPRPYLSQNGIDQNQLIVLSLLRDKSYQLFKEHTKEFENHENKAKQIIESGYEINTNQFTHQIFDLMKNKIMEILTKHALSIFQLTQELPGFQQFERNDLNSLIKENFFFLFGVRTKCLCKNNDYFLFLDQDIQLNKDALAIIVGETVRDNIFDFNSLFSVLNLTDAEFALLIPFFLSIPSK